MSSEVCSEIVKMHLRASYFKNSPGEHALAPPSLASRLRRSRSRLRRSIVFLPLSFPQRWRISLFGNLQVGASSVFIMVDQFQYGLCVRVCCLTKYCKSTHNLSQCTIYSKFEQCPPEYLLVKSFRL